MGFLDKYIDQLIRFSDVPNFQNERAIFTILSLYIEEIIQYKLENNGVNEKYKFVGIESPITKNKNNQGTNTDYLMLDEEKKVALLIELKTGRQSNDHCFWPQIFNYEVMKTKENNTIKEELSPICDIATIKVIYIVPDCIAENELVDPKAKCVDYTIKFSELSKMSFDDDWEIIKRYINKLNICYRKRCKKTSCVLYKSKTTQRIGNQT